MIAHLLTVAAAAGAGPLGADPGMRRVSCAACLQRIFLPEVSPQWISRPLKGFLNSQQAPPRRPDQTLDSPKIGPKKRWGGVQEILPCQVVLDDDERGAVMANMKGRFLYI